MNNPIELLSVIVSVYAYMHEVAYYRKHSKSEGSPACIYFDIDKVRKEITLITRLPKKPSSNVSDEGNPWNPNLSHHSKEAVLDCAKLILTLAFGVGMPTKSFGDHEFNRIAKWRFLIRDKKRHLHGELEGQLKNLLTQMLESEPVQRISMIKVIQGLNDLQFSHPWIGKFIFVNCTIR